MNVGTLVVGWGVLADVYLFMGASPWSPPVLKTRIQSGLKATQKMMHGGWDYKQSKNRNAAASHVSRF